MTTDPPIVARDDGTVLVSGAAVPLLYRAVHALAIRHHHDGIAPPPLLHEARAALFRATMSPRCHEVSNALETLACSDGLDGAYVDSTAAAEILGLSRRQVQRLTAKDDGLLLGAVRCGSVWLYRRDTVQALAKGREHDRTNGLPR